MRNSQDRCPFRSPVRNPETTEISACRAEASSERFVNVGMYVSALTKNCCISDARLGASFSVSNASSWIFGMRRLRAICDLPNRDARGRGPAGPPLALGFTIFPCVKRADSGNASTAMYQCHAGRRDSSRVSRQFPRFLDGSRTGFTLIYPGGAIPEV